MVLWGRPGSGRPFSCFRKTAEGPRHPPSAPGSTPKKKHLFRRPPLNTAAQSVPGGSPTRGCRFATEGQYTGTTKNTRRRNRFANRATRKTPSAILKKTAELWSTRRSDLDQPMAPTPDQTCSPPKLCRTNRTHVPSQRQPGLSSTSSRDFMRCPSSPQPARSNRL
jgi:hypothetical protein